MSSVEDSSRENCRGVRIGFSVFVAGSWDGKMEMWRGLFCLVFAASSAQISILWFAPGQSGGAPLCSGVSLHSGL